MRSKVREGSSLQMEPNKYLRKIKRKKRSMEMLILMKAKTTEHWENNKDSSHPEFLTGVKIRKEGKDY